MNQGKVDVVKQEMERVNIDILGIIENGQERANLIQMTIIATIVGKNLLEEMKQPSKSTKESKMKYLGTISKMIGWSQFISKANNSTSQ